MGQVLALFTLPSSCPALTQVPASPDLSVFPSWPCRFIGNLDNSRAGQNDMAEGNKTPPKGSFPPSPVVVCTVSAERTPCLGEGWVGTSHIGVTARRCPALLGYLKTRQFALCRCWRSLSSRKKSVGIQEWQPWALNRESSFFTIPLLAPWKRALKARRVIQVKIRSIQLY